MKYIVMQVTNPSGLALEIPFLFPEICVHLFVATVAKVMLEEQFPGSTIVPISAGQLSSMSIEDESCHGNSSSLKLDSRGDIDSELIRMSDYGSLYK